MLRPYIIFGLSSSQRTPRLRRYIVRTTRNSALPLIMRA